MCRNIQAKSPAEIDAQLFNIIVSAKINYLDYMMAEELYRTFRTSSNGAFMMSSYRLKGAVELILQTTSVSSEGTVVEHMFGLEEKFNSMRKPERDNVQLVNQMRKDYLDLVIQSTYLDERDRKLGRQLALKSNLFDYDPSGEGCSDEEKQKIARFFSMDAMGFIEQRIKSARKNSEDKLIQGISKKAIVEHIVAHPQEAQLFLKGPQFKAYLIKHPDEITRMISHPYSSPELREAIRKSGLLNIKNFSLRKLGVFNKDLLKAATNKVDAIFENHDLVAENKEDSFFIDELSHDEYSDLRHQLESEFKEFSTAFRPQVYVPIAK